MPLLLEPGSPFQAPLMKFLLRYPQESVDMFLNENNILEQQWNRCLLQKHPAQYLGLGELPELVSKVWNFFVLSESF